MPVRGVRDERLAMNRSVVQSSLPAAEEALYQGRRILALAQDLYARLSARYAARSADGGEAAPAPVAKRTRETS